MKKSIFLCTCIFALAIGAVGQEKKKSDYIAKPRLSVGAELTFPTETGFGERFSTGFGGSAKFEVPVTEQFYGTLSAGFLEFFLKEKYQNLTFNKTYVPLKAGAKYYLQHSLYGEAEVGASVGTNKGAGTAFAWASGLGVSLPILKDHYIDAGARYEKWARDGGNINQWGFRAAYKF